MAFRDCQPELLPGAKNAVETCLAVQAGEHVALIADAESSAVAASLAAALQNVQATTNGIIAGGLWSPAAARRSGAGAGGAGKKRTLEFWR